jgi:hypothetical protein
LLIDNSFQQQNFFRAVYFTLDLRYRYRYTAASFYQAILSRKKRIFFGQDIRKQQMYPSQ